MVEAQKLQKHWVKCLLPFSLISVREALQKMKILLTTLKCKVGLYIVLQMSVR